MQIRKPKALKKGDTICVIAPSRSLSIISSETQEIATNRLKDMGFNITFGTNVSDDEIFSAGSIKGRVDDLHAAFSDKNVAAILTVIGGFNSNQILDYIDWQVLRDNPKIFCGFSDITILNNAFYKMAKLVSFYGPHYSTFGQKLHFEFTKKYFKNCLFNNDTLVVESNPTWTDDLWFLEQNKRSPLKNDGHLVINSGSASGTLLGGHLGTFTLLAGTKYFPDLTDSILLVEVTESSDGPIFDRQLCSILQQQNANKIKALLIGRFQRKSGVTFDELRKIISSKELLQGIPVIANLNFGHTDPKLTLPIGGKASIDASDNEVVIKILERLTT